MFSSFAEPVRAVQNRRLMSRSVSMLSIIHQLKNIFIFNMLRFIEQIFRVICQLPANENQVQEGTYFNIFLQTWSFTFFRQLPIN